MSRFAAFYNIVNRGFQRAQTFGNRMNPATKEKLWDVSVATRRELDDAAEAANTTHQSWLRMPVNERDRLLEAFYDEFIKYESQFSE